MEMRGKVIIRGLNVVIIRNHVFLKEEIIKMKRIIIVMRKNEVLFKIIAEIEINLNKM